MKEADHKRKLVAEVNALRGGYARRIEDRFAVGVLDLIIKLPGVALIFAEGKLIDGNLFGPSERQFIEGERIMAANMNVLLLGWKSGVLYISPWVKQADIRNCFSGQSGWSQLTVLREYINEPR